VIKSRTVDNSDCSADFKIYRHLSVESYCTVCRDNSLARWHSLVSNSE